jgi:nitric oxide reductase large subunit
MSREIRQGYLGTLITLIAQFLLGRVTNLFVQVPLNHPGANPPEYFSGVFQSVTWAILHGPSLWLTLHAVLGLLLVVFGFRLLVPAIRSRNRTAIITAVTGAVAMLGAGFNGGSYLNYHEDFSSMIMASFFAIAVTVYAVGLWALPLQPGSQTRAARSPAPPAAQSR